MNFVSPFITVVSWIKGTIWIVIYTKAKAICIQNCGTVDDVSLTIYSCIKAFLFYQNIGEMSRKHQEKYEKAKSKREMIIENLRKKSEDKILRAEEKRKKRIAKQKEKLKAVEERLAKVRCRKETIDKNFREKTVTKLVEDEERLRTLQQSDLPLRAIFRREEILRYRQKLYEERQQCKERTVNKNQFL